MATPRFVPPMLATLADEPFSRRGWVFEPKLDGIRCLAIRNGPHVELWSRNQLDLTGRFSRIADALGKQKQQRFVVDGEVVVFRGDVTSFEALQQGAGPVFFYLFDILHAGGRDTRDLSLLERKALLTSTIRFTDPIRYSEHTDEAGEAMYREACDKGWEGVIAKDAQAPYVSARSKAWLKFKCLESQELVIGGWTDPTGSREEFGALLVGYHEGDRLRFAGKVGTGFTRDALRKVAAAMRKLRTAESPFTGEKGLPRAAHWVRPELVAQIGFHEWTAGGKLRQPRFQGLRDDKAARSVVRERKQRG